MRRALKILAITLAVITFIIVARFNVSSAIARYNAEIVASVEADLQRCYFTSDRKQVYCTTSEGVSIPARIERRYEGGADLWGSYGKAEWYKEPVIHCER